MAVTLEDLNNGIIATRDRIQKLTERRKLLSATILSDSRIAERLIEDAIASPNDVSFAHVDQTSRIDAHRTAFSCTAFSFTDPSPRERGKKLLGIRFDVCTSLGIFQKPYYALLKPTVGPKKMLRVYRHTIPTYIKVEKLADKFLAEADFEEQEGHETTPMANHNIHRFVEKLREELTAWHLRHEAMEMVRKIVLRDEDHAEADEFGIVKLEFTTTEAKRAVLHWRDGKAGAIQVDRNGKILKAAIFDEEKHHCKTAEEHFEGRSLHLEELPQVLRMMQEIGSENIGRQAFVGDEAIIYS